MNAVIIYMLTTLYQKVVEGIILSFVVVIGVSTGVYITFILLRNLIPQTIIKLIEFQRQKHFDDMEVVRSWRFGRSVGNDN